MIRLLQGPELSFAEYRSSRVWTHTVVVQLPRAIQLIDQPQLFACAAVNSRYPTWTRNPVAVGR